MLDAKCDATAAYSLFLDFDGTLADIANTPNSVKIPTETVQDVLRLHQILGGALALVSGRSIAEIDHLFSPIRLPVAGVHGAQRRTSLNTCFNVDPPNLSTLIEVAKFRLGHLPGLIIEAKPAAVALHYRLAPEHERDCWACAELLVQTYPGWVAFQGKCVIEVKPEGVSKGVAVRAFLKEVPFMGRLFPIFIGDDVTDETGFAAVNEIGGISIKVGHGPTCATHRIASPQDVRSMLSHWVAQGNIQETLQSLQNLN